MATGNLFILAAPSGAGKSSLIKALLERNQDGSMQVSVSHTTRSPRPGEQQAVHYHFVDESAFKQMIADDAFFEWAEVFGKYYGTSKQAIADTLEQGKDVFLDIDWQGARQVKAQMPDTATIFIAPPSRDELLRRLKHRNTDSDEVISERMAKARDEISHYQEFDYVVVNDDFEQALKEIEAIVLCQRLAQTKQARRHQKLFAELLK
ncbi:guanylate kinase [Lacimicrobium alkaliphilum]|uniref:Guanylate kinase n=1 Tax=Lacimicrobium alkaliphilum TaxID=1526571 RepID=A0A0U3AW62_9ALTE|nr:guanylate kinase [Lacimicrobium alkaliphilum]ALS97136.1 guanylate kinase [Lacimicrobium alkaliphilum]